MASGRASGHCSHKVLLYTWVHPGLCNDGVHAIKMPDERTVSLLHSEAPYRDKDRIVIEVRNEVVTPSVYC